MRLSPLRIFWISIISMFAMLSSSFASSAPLMTWQMISASTHQSEAEAPSGCVMMDSSQMSHSMPMSHSSMEESSSHCMSDAPSIHNCCTAACVSVFAFLPQTAYSLPAQYQLALIPYESAKSVVQRQQSLYRPPIA
ncbi:hypothetical protein FXE87_08510 [Vibrio mimicus]|uniref:DUF2946 domain-containing protein n=2 Tax=Vibrionaceae TaxID=641 RepID=A0A2J9VKP8_VIBMI|nr:conserved hypothetical protein [Vibrio mimicus VM573]ERM52929.1 hypothetical protein P780_18190 [Vibrio mimicus CAIM 1882]ERM53120.1 hypothetical protein P781_18135 [Vibrio mimicus CAIM 1883]KQA20349.1 hypothetical protein AAY52_01415 [Vibrio metoecus]PNM64349.1 hypothetical protein AL544_005395 [Vibrio mimicus]